MGDKIKYEMGGEYGMHVGKIPTAYYIILTENF